MDKNKAIDKRRLRRRYHVRSALKGTADCPRLTVSRSLKHISCQLVDDLTGRTLVAAGTQEKDQRGTYGGNVDAAKKIGALIAERAKAAGIDRVKFDRGHCKYHGRVAALADGAREAGLQF